jgi:hypothetical protein
VSLASVIAGFLGETRRAGLHSEIRAVGFVLRLRLFPQWRVDPAFGIRSIRVWSKISEAFSPEPLSASSKIIGRNASQTTTVRMHEEPLSAACLSDTPNISAVILDYGQVLARCPSKEEFARMAAMFNVNFDSFFELWEASRGPYDRGDFSAEEMLFVDDREPNIRTARALGMHALGSNQSRNLGTIWKRLVFGDTGEDIIVYRHERRPQIPRLVR